MNTKLRFSFAALCAATLAACGGGAGDATRDSVKVVGSSTVYPFTTAVAEEFQRANPGKSVIVESTGTRGLARDFLIVGRQPSAGRLRRSADAPIAHERPPEGKRDPGHQNRMQNPRRYVGT